VWARPCGGVIAELSTNYARISDAREKGREGEQGRDCPDPRPRRGDSAQRGPRQGIDPQLLAAVTGCAPKGDRQRLACLGAGLRARGSHRVGRGGPRGARSPAPGARTRSFGESAIEYEVLFYIDDFERALVIEGGVRDRIDYAFARSGIEMPFPTRTLVLAPQDAGAQREATRRRCAAAIGWVPLLQPLPLDAREVLAARASTGSRSIKCSPPIQRSSTAWGTFSSGGKPRSASRGRPRLPRLSQSARGGSSARSVSSSSWCNPCGLLRGPCVQCAQETGACLRRSSQTGPGGRARDELLLLSQAMHAS
jgi:hypothetical protein